VFCVLLRKILSQNSPRSTVYTSKHQALYGNIYLKEENSYILTDFEMGFQNTEGISSQLILTPELM